MLLWIVLASFLVIGGIAMMIFGQAARGEDKYCNRCRRVTFWHSRRGCERCVWLERK